MRGQNQQLQLPFDAGLIRGLQEYVRRTAVWGCVVGCSFLALAVLWLTLRYLPVLFPFAAGAGTLMVIWCSLRFTKAISTERSAVGLLNLDEESDVKKSWHRCEITLRGTDGRGIKVTAGGSVVIGTATSELQYVLAGLIDEYKQVTIDLSGVATLDAAGLSALKSVRAAARSKGTRVIFLNLTPLHALLIGLDSTDDFHYSA